MVVARRRRRAARRRLRQRPARRAARSTASRRCATGCPRCCAERARPGAQLSFGGETALADETVDARRSTTSSAIGGRRARWSTSLLLALFLRALVAPLYLVAASVLGLAASLGLTTFVFQDVLGDDDLTYYVPFAAAVLLVALGSDYNVFVAGRIWEEARRLPPARGDRRRDARRPRRRSPSPASRWPRRSRCWRSSRCARSASSRS